MGPFPSSVSKAAYAEGFEKYWGTLTSDDVTFIRVIR